MADKIGPNFANELAAVGLLGLQFSWGSDGAFCWGETITANQKAAVERVYAAHDPTKDDPKATYAAAIKSGLAIVSISSPELNGTYGIAPQDEINLTGLQVAVSASVFPGYCRDMAGTKHVLSAAQFTVLATAVLNYIAALDEARQAALTGASATWPTEPVTIT